MAKTKVIHVAVEPKTFDDLRKVAKWLDCSKSQAIRAAIKRYMHEHEALMGRKP